MKVLVSNLMTNHSILFNVSKSYRVVRRVLYGGYHSLHVTSLNQSDDIIPCMSHRLTNQITSFLARHIS